MRLSFCVPTEFFAKFRIFGSPSAENIVYSLRGDIHPSISPKEANTVKQPTAALPSDERIIELYWNRDEAAITETDRKYRSYLHTVAWNIVKDEQDCEECLNDTYLKTWNSIPPQRPSCLKAFLTKITRSIAIDRYRRERRQKRVPSECTLSLRAG
jgi:hypothetical protein